MRLLFAGTPEVAVPALEALLDSEHEVVGVLTRADARSGRGRTLAPSPVKVRALAAGLEVFTDDPKSPEFAEKLAALNIDCAPVVAYGQLLRRNVLDIPTHGWINLHFSLLPAWRGAAPVQRSIMAGDQVTGAATFRIEEGLDTGPVYGVMTEAVRSTDTAGDLLARLADAGAGLLVATMDGIADGSLEAREQPSEGVSLAPKLSVTEAEVDWTRPALALDRHIRGCTPEPGAWTTFRGERLGLGPVDPVGLDQPSLPAGALLADKKSVIVGTGTGPVLLGTVQPPGKRAMAAADWARGARIDVGEGLGG